VTVSNFMGLSCRSWALNLIHYTEFLLERIRGLRTDAAR